MRAAGLCYLAVILLGVAQAGLVSSHLPALEDPEAVVAVLIDQGLRVRLGVLGDVVLYALVLVLAAALYLVLRGVHRPLALGGLVLRSAEAMVGLTVTLVGGAGPLLLLSDPSAASPGPVVALLAVREAALDGVLILVGLGGAAFCQAFFLSRLVPGALALRGVLTYGSMVVLGRHGSWCRISRRRSPVSSSPRAPSSSFSSGSGWLPGAERSPSVRARWPRPLPRDMGADPTTA